jgi:putative Holliday junction resolvase
VVLDMGALRAVLPRDSRLLGVDPGSKTIGLALSDVSLMLATPFAQIPRGKLGVTAKALARIVAEHDIGGLVVGLPLSMDGSKGPAAQAARDWTHAIADALGLPAAMWDERLSSAAANRVLIGEMDLSRAKRAQLVDAMAASYMLQAALDASASNG